MEELVTGYLSQMLQSYSVLAILLVFAGGIITSLGPCNISMIPLLMAYVSGTSNVNKVRSFWLSLSFTLGTSTTFALLGVIAAIIGGVFGTSKLFLIYLASVICILVGLKMLGVISFQLPSFSSKILRKPNQQGVLPAFFLGLTIGLAGSQCGTPVLFAILSLVMSKGKIIYGALLLFLYGLGRGVPVIIAGTFTGIAKGLPGLAKWSRVFEQFAGIVLIGLGLYYFWSTL